MPAQSQDETSAFERLSKVNICRQVVTSLFGSGTLAQLQGWHPGQQWIQDPFVGDLAQFSPLYALLLMLTQGYLLGDVLPGAWH